MNYKEVLEQMPNRYWIRTKLGLIQNLHNFVKWCDLNNKYDVECLKYLYDNYKELKTEKR